ncbi:MAG: prephenate dehydratase [Blautia sp.]|jgi:chorismate mutase/prephenate dehydratase
MIDLQKSREQIDEIDCQIVSLFEERMRVAEQVAEYKISTGKQVLDTKREQDKLDTLQTMTHNEFNSLGVRELFQQIMTMSRKKQYQLLTAKGALKLPQEFEMVDALPKEDKTIVYQGVEGAYSYAAMQQFFGEDARHFHVKTWKDAMDAIVSGKADYAVLPIENSTAGIVSDIYDLLAEYDELYIVGEQIIKCEHVLMGLCGTKISDIKTVYSHRQGLMQCRKFLEEHLEWEQVALENTAVAAAKVSRDGDLSQAAIASRSAAKVCGLEILQENIFNNLNNSTRFVIVSKRPVFAADAAKISIGFEVPHESGSLYSMLSHVIYNGLNMTKIESRPIPGKNWQYRFFMDFEGNLTDASVKNALVGIHREAEKMRVYGNY